jgi:hypothetical protein
MATEIKDIFTGVELPEEVHSQVSEAWESKLSEAREDITAELREEFAQRYENDKAQIVEAMDKMLTDKITTEMKEFAEDKAALVSERVAYKENVAKHTAMLEKFVSEMLVKEVKELHADRDGLKENFAKLEDFVVKQLSKELNEFNEDKQALVDHKVKMVAEGKKIIEDAKSRFISKAAGIVETAIDKTLRSEISDLKEDIKVARENNFGRKVFEAFAGEYMSSHLAEDTEIRKLQSELTDQHNVAQKLEDTIAEKDEALKVAETKIKVAEDKVNRSNVLSELTAPLNKEKRQIMLELLESVKTENLQRQFSKYLPAVLKEEKIAEDKTVITEVTGDRTSPDTADTPVNTDIIKIKQLAGLRS